MQKKMKSMTRLYILTLLSICFSSCLNDYKYNITRDYIESPVDLINFELCKYSNNNPTDTIFEKFKYDQCATCCNNYQCSDKPKKKVYFNEIDDCYIWTVQGYPSDTLPIKLENGFWYSISGLESVHLATTEIYFYLFSDGKIKTYYASNRSSNI